MIEYLILKEKKRKKIEHLTVLREIMLLLFEYTILFWEFFVQSFLRGLYIARIDLFCWQKPLAREREEDKKKALRPTCHIVQLSIVKTDDSGCHLMFQKKKKKSSSALY